MVPRPKSMDARADLLDHAGGFMTHDHGQVLDVPEAVDQVVVAVAHAGSRHPDHDLAGLRGQDLDLFDCRWFSLFVKDDCFAAHGEGSRLLAATGGCDRPIV